MLKKESKSTLHTIVSRIGGEGMNANKNKTEQSTDNPKHQKET
jgi:hypothetical protein